METLSHKTLEHIQQNDYTSDYRTCLMKVSYCHLCTSLTLMIFITSLKFPTSSFNIKDHVHVTIRYTCLTISSKLQ